MKRIIVQLWLLCYLLLVTNAVAAQSPGDTYCNPINIDYGYCPIPGFTEWGRHRATADPVIVQYKGDYYLFATNQWGYWWSPDLLHWQFIARKFLKPQHHVYDELCAPAVWVMGDTLLVFGSTYTADFPVWMSTNPKANEWKEAVDSLTIGGWDPAFFPDDDGRLYMYNGSSNRYPLYGVEMNRRTWQPLGARRELYLLEPDRYGWQRFGELLDNTFLDPFIEGAWMTKHNGRYYLQYGAPGTEFSGYADGVVVSDHPLGPFVPQAHNPVAYKPGGFARGAGHGATFRDNKGYWWHVSTLVIAVKNSFERRIGLWPMGFDSSGTMFCNTAFGDYPHYLLQGNGNAPTSTTFQATAQTFTGWMLLNYNKPVTVSSTLGGYLPNYAVDENIKTYWSAATGHAGEWIATDLGQLSTVNAVQINYADQDAEWMGKQTDSYHQYKLYYSTDGRHWKILADKSKNKTDVPHDYVPLKTPVAARFIKLENIHMPGGKFAVSGLRVFGQGGGTAPDTVAGFQVLRTEKDKRSAWLKWSPVDHAWAYNIYTGIAPDQLYNCIMVHGSNEYYFKGMDKERPYYFTIEAINENGVSARSRIIKAE
ncbi:family 43 glycosylhydrolase [Chitinophaga nivalis]|uniref:Family 43 glycosylhydrolase n=1 Tax=Chitinophaga nivalis TaxID=2991709 RepID=A0ABT3ING0_9BACT|nr:family 43 glycosylhydrolase [Chitinophaga nivalis]MCW3464873.1 family 43 glycosylhydrolase [Chitinophaga nivalis]MCW3485436.1 family 43 glycosylhydrolase [Chitinophaga nivalis]